jgi:hypothetical protein
MYDSTTPLASRSAKSVTVDNLMRRALRVSDPDDPVQVADGLLARYPEIADRIERERLGLNRRSIAEPKLADGGLAGAGGAEVAQAKDDLERDLATLLHASELKDIAVELKGWGRAVRKAAAEGLAAAPLALDIVQNDKAMAARRMLSEYARLARYVGALAPDSRARFRRLAQSLDVLAALILVGIGEGLAARGVTRATAIIRVSGAELRARRDAVMAALRALTGSGLATLGQDQYPRGLEAYRILARRLEAAGQSDIRGHLEISTMGQSLDSLLDLTAGADPSGLRELTTASAVLVGRLSRLAAFCRAEQLELDEERTGSPDSPPLAYFASALQMFIDAFRPASGSRLIFVARPSIITYGLYGLAAPDPASERLAMVAMARGRIAELVDCHAACACDDTTAGRQILLDFLLERIDRAIDLYAAGSLPEGDGDPEIAASAFSWFLDRAHHLPVEEQVPAPQQLRSPESDPTRQIGLDPNIGSHGPVNGQSNLLEHVPLELETRLNSVADQIRGDRLELHPALRRELTASYLAEIRLERLAAALAPGCYGHASRVREVIASILGCHPTEEPGPILPPTPAATLDSLVFNAPATAYREET